MEASKKQRSTAQQKSPHEEADALRGEIGSLRTKLKAAEREAKRFASQAADAERRATFAQEVLAEERRQVERERVGLEGRVTAPVVSVATEALHPEPEAPSQAEPDVPAVVVNEHLVEPQASKPGRRSLGRLVRKREPLPATPRKCNVCGRPIGVGDHDELRAGGWLVSGKVAVCGQCKADGWELEQEALLPFRRPSHNDSVNTPSP